jgi:hypothetical protein
MEMRPFFVIGDFFANVLTAILAITAATKLIGGVLGMLPGMLIGMLMGMLIAVVVAMLLVPVLGIMETMLSCMLSGMLAGMCGGMWVFDAPEILSWGISIGLAMMVLVYTLNLVVTGPQHPEG